MTKPSDEERALAEVRQAVLGVLDKMSETLKEAPDKMEKALKDLTEQSRKVSMIITMTSGLTKNDKEVLDKAKKAIDEHIGELSRDNQLTHKKVREARQGLNEVKADLQNATTRRTPTPGRS